MPKHVPSTRPAQWVMPPDRIEGYLRGQAEKPPAIDLRGTCPACGHGRGSKVHKARAARCAVANRARGGGR